MKGEGTREASEVYAEPGREMQAMGEKCPLGERGLGRSWPASVDIKGRPCWISGSGDGDVPISLSNCQKNLI